MAESLPGTLPGVLRAAAERHADRPAFVDGDRTVSFAELLDLVQATAGGYVDLGFSPGDRLVLWAPNSIGWVVAALATSYAGGTLIPANSRYTAHEVADLIERTDARIVVIADGFLDRTQRADLAPLVPGRTLVDVTALPSTDDPETAAEVEARADAVTPDDVADILFTSGTTGKPKGAMSAHRQTIGVARAWADVAGIRADDRYLVVNPFFHSFGYKIGIVVGLLTGCTLYPVATFDLDETMSLIERASITVFPGAPAVYQSMLAVDRSGHDLSSLRLAVTGAAMIPVVLIERMKDELGFDDVLTAFGMTEAVVVTMCRQGDDAETIANTSGRAIPGMETAIGPDGELLVRGDHVMLGYLDDPQATAAAIDADGWLHTGDVGELDDAGNLKITDRLKDMYISGGFNVYPAEVEQTLLRAEGVQDVAVIGVPDERMGEVGKAFVVGTASADELLAFARERLANFKIPRYVESIDALPRNLSGKVLKTELRSRG
ncbi:MAG TPA: FadD3 family acyl-CoA ligase [Aeromicrobium sp.]|nr:FadD3 family acyl-CoA ligase [Aeromicrobium sp.]HKY57402.1 FadD3 family acyl-CoA ligase [Aeromicrobium sp.]